ncbi:hypothetical protein [Nesterenkonia rhizosphaerae]|uniref:Uncharacterized protein n=1 Tax=Nesterenkonia rhizosphaerae TaxID=1348272 RepID=A0ABP9FZB6_9MICC
MTDSPKAHLTEAEFLAKTQEFQPFQFTLGGRKGTITFPDFNAGSVAEARAMEHKIQTAIDPLDALEKWLPAEEFAKLKSANLNARKISALFEMAHTYTNGEKRARRHVKASDLDAECKDPAPFTFVLKNSKRVVFPDFASGTVEEMREFYQVLHMNRTDPELILQKWIGDKSWDALQSLNLNARQLAALCDEAIAHYQATRGSLGE